MSRYDMLCARWRTLQNEMTALTGRFLSEAEQLRVLSLGDEIDRCESELDAFEQEHVA